MSVAVRIAVAGAAGRMGAAIINEIADQPACMLAAALERAGSPHLGQSPHGAAVPYAHSDACEWDQIDVVIDFSTAAAAAALATKLAEARSQGRHAPRLVIGATGFTEAERAQIDIAAERLPILLSGNMSLGVNLLAALVERAAAALGPDWDIEITEAHHRHKKDAPSGTALMLGEAAARGRGVSLADVETRTRDGLTGERQPGAIGFSVIRGGGVPGDHDARFMARDEVLTLSHRALDRRVFAKGAVEAALWLSRQDSPGLYAMRDVLVLGAV